MTKMKFVLSPAKTQHVTNRIPQSAMVGLKDPSVFRENKMAPVTLKLIERLRAMTPESLGGVLNIKGKLLTHTYDLYQNWDHLACQPAILLYNGLVFQQLDTESYLPEDWSYIQKHVVILSALYGVVNPMVSVRPYRLDLTANLFEGDPYGYWQPYVQSQFDDSTLIVDLASEEFSKLLTCQRIKIHFKERQPNGKLITKATHAKMARGAMVDYAVKQKIQKLKTLKAFAWQGYCYSDSDSDEWNLYFIKERD